MSGPPSVVVPTCSLGELDAVDLVGLRDVQLVEVGDLLEVCALVQSTAQACLPHGGVVTALLVFPFVHSPCLLRGGMMRLSKVVDPMFVCQVFLSLQ